MTLPTAEPETAARRRVMKRDLMRELRACYDCSANKVSKLVVPVAPFLAIDGGGDPNTSPAYASAVEALFPLACTITFAVKRGAQAIDYA